MGSKRVWSYLAGGLGTLALLLWGALWAMTTSAAPPAQVVGTLDVSPTVVSPSNAVGIGRRLVTITLTDADLNKPRFIGSGPNQELPSSGAARVVIPAGSRQGDRIEVRLGSTVAPTVGLAGTFGSAVDVPIIDRDGSGTVTLADIEFVNDDLIANAAPGGPATSDGNADLRLFSLVDAQLGIFSIIWDAAFTLTGDRTYQVRYATSGTDLSRAAQSYTEALTIPNTGLIAGQITGESTTRQLNLVLQDTDGDGVTSGDDVFFAAPDSLRVLDGVTTGATSVTLEATAPIALGAPILLAYLGDDLLTVPQPIVFFGTFDIRLTNTLLDTNADGVTNAGDITVVFGPVTVQDYFVATNTARFSATQSLNAGDTFTVRYFGLEGFPVSSGVVQGETYTLNLTRDNLPLQDTDGDGAITTLDITVSIPGLLAPSTSLVTPLNIGFNVGIASGDPNHGGAPANVIRLVHSGDAVGRGTGRTQIAVTYLGMGDLVSVKGSNNVEIPLRFRETGRDTGVFTASVVAADFTVNSADQPNPDGLVHPANLDPTAGGNNATGDRPRLAMQDGGAITVIYRDRSPIRTVQVNALAEAEPPIFFDVSPPDGAITSNLNTILSVEVTDNLAGVDPSKGSLGSIDFVRRNQAGNIVQRSVITVDSIPIPISSADISVTETFAGSGVFVVGYNISNLPPIADAIAAGAQIQSVITWETVASDKAGNSAGSGVRTLNVDNIRPAISFIVAGQTFNAATGLFGDSRTSMRVAFSGIMDGTSFQTGDFLVNTGGGPFDPIAVVWFNAVVDSAFLTVPELAPDATPRVEIVGEVLDNGGNAVPIGTTGDALDGIPPRLDVTFVNNYTTGDVTLNVVSDEQIIATTPSRDFFLCVVEVGGALDCRDPALRLTPPTTITVIQERQEWRFDLAGLPSGRYNMQLAVQDANGNQGTAGVLTNVTTADNALNFEIDMALPAPLGTTPAKDATATEREPFVIEIDWSSEGPPSGDYPGDTHSRVTLTKAVLDEGTANERDVLSLASTFNNRRFSIPIPNIGPGQHTLTFNGADGAGNTRFSDEAITFTVVAPPTFDLTLTPGMNFISVPGNPADPDINTVLNGIPEVDLVFTRESDRWLVAQRIGTGDFTGDLTTIDARHAYFVRSLATVTVNIDIPTQSTQQLLPQIYVRPHRWTLVPVISLLPVTFDFGVNQIPQGTKLDADDYLGANWSRAFTFDRGQWVSIRKGTAAAPVTPQCDNPGAAAGTGNCWGSVGLPFGEFFTVPTAALDDGVQIGRGYWVWFTERDFIIP